MKHAKCNPHEILLGSYREKGKAVKEAPFCRFQMAAQAVFSFYKEIKDFLCAKNIMPPEELDKLNIGLHILRGGWKDPLCGMALQLWLVICSTLTHWKLSHFVSSQSLCCPRTWWSSKSYLLSEKVWTNKLNPRESLAISAEAAAVCHPGEISCQPCRFTPAHANKNHPISLPCVHMWCPGVLLYTPATTDLTLIFWHTKSNCIWIFVDVHVFKVRLSVEWNYPQMVSQWDSKHSPISNRRGRLSL